MKTTTLLTACALSISVLSGCGAVNSLLGDMSPGGDMTAPKLYLLEPGNYQLLAIRDEMDGCKIDDGTLLMGANAIYTLTNDNMGNIVMQGFGSGQISANMGTLSKQKVGFMAGATCTYTYNRNYPITLTADNTFTLKGSELQTMRDAACIPAVGTMCTTSWTLDFKKAP